MEMSLKEIQHVPGVFAEIMGDVGYIFNTETERTDARDN